MSLPGWTVFEWQEREEAEDGGRKSGRFILLSDSADAQSLRRLRMWLADGHARHRHHRAAQESI
jgi:hypothetical protein